jgi:hypothetical protein
MVYTYFGQRGCHWDSWRQCEATRRKTSRICGNVSGNIDEPTRGWKVGCLGLGALN